MVYVQFDAKTSFQDSIAKNDQFVNYVTKKFQIGSFNKVNIFE